MNVFPVPRGVLHYGGVKYNTFKELRLGGIPTLEKMTFA